MLSSPSGCPMENSPMTLPGNQTLLAFLPALISKDGILNPQSLLWMELIRFMIHEANDAGSIRGNLMGNYYLGYTIYDTCNDADVILKQAMDIILDDSTYNKYNGKLTFSCDVVDRNKEHLCTQMFKTTDLIVGTLLGVTSDLIHHIIPVLTAMNWMNLRLTNFAASPDADVWFGNKTKYYIRSTAIPDVYHVAALEEFILTFNWTYVGMIYSNEKENLDRNHLMLQALSKMNICIGFNELLSADTYKTAMTVKSDTYATGIIVFANHILTVELMKAIININVTARVWVFGSQVNQASFESTQLRNAGHLLFALTITSGIFQRFENYFWNLKSSDTGNPWLDAFFQVVKFNESRTYTVGDFRHLFMLSDLGFLYNAVESHLAPAKLLAEGGWYANFLYYLSSLTWLFYSHPMLFDLAGKISFTSLMGHSLRFNKQGRANEKIFRVFATGAGLQHGKFQSVGIWTYNTGWYMTAYIDIPKSSCESECRVGYQLSQYKAQHCCLSCKKCPKGFIKTNTRAKFCTRCHGDSITNNNRTACNYFTTRHLNWQSTNGHTIILLSVATMILSLVVMLTFYLNRTTPVVKSSDIKMLAMQLTVHLLTCSIAFMFFYEPTSFMCQARFFTLFLLLRLQISILLVKTERLLYIFAAKVKLQRRSIFLTASVEIFVICLLTTMGAAITLIYSASEAITVTTNRNERTMIKDIYCDYSDHLLLQTAYIAVLTTACFVQAFRARKLPENFNETKFIMLASFVWLLVLLTSVPVHISNTNGDEKAFVECLTAFLCNTSMLLILYGYKLWIIFFRPYMNTPEYFKQQLFAASKDRAADKFTEMESTNMTGT